METQVKTFVVWGTDGDVKDDEDDDDGKTGHAAEREYLEKAMEVLDKKINVWAKRNSARILSASIASYNSEGDTEYWVGTVVYEK